MGGGEDYFAGKITLLRAGKQEGRKAKVGQEGRKAVKQEVG